ncbi:MAG: N-acetylglucosamine-6-phosphate deacetylase [Propionicimonas sp.]
MPETTLIHGVQLVDDGRVVENGWLLLAGDTITRRGSGDTWPDADNEIDGDGALLAPGFVDIHCHGGGGHSSEDGLEAIHGLVAFQRSRGTTSIVVSLATAPLDLMLQRLADIRTACAGDDRILGAHLEGPFLDAGHRGAHDETLLRVPTPAVVDEMLAVAGGCLRQITLAPEHASAEVLDALLDAGVRIAVGHTSASTSQAAYAFARGASILTHAFNGMPGIHHREPGPIVAALRSGATLEVIADGAHVDPAVIALLFALAPGRVALVTDAMAAAGAADGEYQLAGHTVLVRGGIARVGEHGSLAGSTLTLERAVRVAVGAGVAPAEAIRAATATPARAIGAAAGIGTLTPGAAADLVLLDPSLMVKAVWSRGKRA